MILSYLMSGNFPAAIINFFVLAFIVFAINPIHEFAHAFAAYKLGDNTAKNAGRLTLNPLASFDLFGTLMFLLVGIGWAKPVPINPRNFKGSQKAGTVITAAAGPLSNLIVALISAFISGAVYRFFGLNSTTTNIVFAFMLLMNINIILAAFNLIPLPPLDGSRIAAGLLPDRIYFKLFRYDGSRIAAGLLPDRIYFKLFRYDGLIRNGLMGFMLLSMILRRFGIDLFYPLHWLERFIGFGFIKLAGHVFGVNLDIIYQQIFG